MIVATADPCKFETIIEPIIQRTLPVTTQLQSLLAKPAQVHEVLADINQVCQVLELHNLN